MPCPVLLLRRHGLFGGATGSGKSGGVNVLMGNLTACADVVIWAIDLKRGMELGPWASCIDRLATTPAEARALLADAVAILEARAAYLAAIGKRVWEPTPDMPALVIIIDEYAELTESAPDATSDADSIGRRGRAVAVTLIAATQRPDPEGDGPGRAALPDGRADLLPGPRTQGRRPDPRPGHAGRRLARPQAQRTRQVPDLRTRARHPAPGPRLPAHRRSRERRPRAGTRICGQRWTRCPGPPRAVPGAPQTAQAGGRHQHARVPRASQREPSGRASRRGRALWAALCMAPARRRRQSPELMRVTGMSRPRVYRHLAEHARRRSGHPGQPGPLARDHQARAMTVRDRLTGCLVSRPRARLHGLARIRPMRQTARQSHTVTTGRTNTMTTHQPPGRSYDATITADPPERR